MKFRNAVVVGSLFAVATGCAYLPEGHPSRTEYASPDTLFTNDREPVEVPAAAQRTSGKPDGPGLKIRKAKRGNMESYVVRGQRYHTLDTADGYSARGVASWYGPNFHGRTASNGEVYDMYRLTAAHKTLPLPTYARVTHVENGRSVVVKINDRGPFSGDRIIDLSFAAALRLGMINDGTGTVDIQALSAEEMMVLSGPENKLDIDFYRTAADGSEIELAGADTETETEALPQATEGALVGAVASAGVINVAAANVEDTPITPTPVVTAASVDAVRADDELLAFREDAPATSQAPQAVAQPTANANANAGDSEELLDKSVQDALVPVVAGASVQPVALVPAALQTVSPQAPKDRSGYYIQAGVYADVTDAEIVAVDVVLAAPGEEVNVKPLKGSEMYRITVGPIVSSEHAGNVSAKLSEAGLENFTVNVK